MRNRITFTGLAVLGTAGLLWGLTVNGSMDILGTLTAAQVNFGASAWTQPNKTGTSAPATCSVGQTFFKSDAAAGSNLQLCTAANTWTTVSGGGSTFDPSDSSVVWAREDFATGQSAIGSPVGALQMRTTEVGSGNSLGYELDTIGHPGVLRLTSAATAGAGVWTGYAASGSNGSSKSVTWTDLYSKDWEVTWIAKLSSTTDVRFRVGLDNAKGMAGSANSGSMWIRYDTNASYDDDAKNGGLGSYVAQVCGDDSSNCSGSTTGYTAVLNISPDTNWHKFRIYRTAGKINFQIDGNASKTACLAGGGCDMTLLANPGYGLSYYSNVPAIIIGTDTTAARSLSVDFFAFKMSGVVR